MIDMHKTNQKRRVKVCGDEPRRETLMLRGAIKQALRAEGCVFCGDWPTERLVQALTTQGGYYLETTVTAYPDRIAAFMRRVQSAGLIGRAIVGYSRWAWAEVYVEFKIWPK